RLDLDRDRHGRLGRAVRDREVERVIADVRGQWRPAELTGAARRHRDGRVAIEILEVGRVIAVRQVGAVRRCAVELDVELGANLRNLVAKSPELGWRAGGTGY